LRLTHLSLDACWHMLQAELDGRCQLYHMSPGRRSCAAGLGKPHDASVTLVINVQLPTFQALPDSLDERLYDNRQCSLLSHPQIGISVRALFF
jgi:hypothetical protein